LVLSFEDIASEIFKYFIYKNRVGFLPSRKVFLPLAGEKYLSVWEKWGDIGKTSWMCLI